MKISLKRTYVRSVSQMMIAALLLGACADVSPNPTSTSIKNVPEASAEATQETQVETPMIMDTQKPSVPDPISPELLEFSGEKALELVKVQLAFGNRIPGSEPHARTGNWILERLLEYGWSVEEQKFSANGFMGRNIIGMAGPENGEWLILGAHYDTRPVSDRDEQQPLNPVPGANDGASGVAVLLELARVLRPEELKRPIWIVFFDLEDSGGIDGMEWIVGSRYFVEQLLTYPTAAIIVDMVGDTDLQLYYEMNSNVEINSAIWKVAAEQGFTSFIPELNHSLLDDHTPFLLHGIPAIDIIDFDYPYWHTTEDTLDKVSAISLAQVGQTLVTWLRSE